MQELYNEHKPAGQIFFKVEFFPNGKLENNIRNLAYQKNAIFSSKYNNFGKSRSGLSRVPDQNSEQQNKISNSLSNSLNNQFERKLRNTSVNNSRQMDDNGVHNINNQQQNNPHLRNSNFETRYKTLYDDYGEEYYRTQPSELLRNNQQQQRIPSVHNSLEREQQHTKRDNSLINKFLQPKNTIVGDSKQNRSFYDRNNYYDDKNDPYDNPYHYKQQEQYHHENKQIHKTPTNISNIYPVRNEEHIMINPEVRYSHENPMYHSVYVDTHHPDPHYNNQKEIRHHSPSPRDHYYNNNDHHYMRNHSSNQRDNHPDNFDNDKSVYMYNKTEVHSLNRPHNMAPVKRDEDYYKVPEKRDPNDTFKSIIKDRKTTTPSILKDIKPGDPIRSPPRDRFVFDESYNNPTKVDPYANTLNRIEQLKSTGGLNDTKFDLKNSLDPYIYFRNNSTQIFQYEIKANKWKSLPNYKNFYFPKHFSVCQLPDNTYFLTGGELNMLSLNTTHYYTGGNIIDLASMISVRKGHNSIYHEGFVYVFGGFYDEKSIIKDCERYNFKTKQWTPIARMNFAKAYTTPVVHGNKYIYLVGGFSSTTQFEGVNNYITLAL
jgi:hypothetical protein